MNRKKEDAEKKVSTSFSLSPQVIECILSSSQSKGISKASVAEMIFRQHFRLNSAGDESEKKPIRFPLVPQSSIKSAKPAQPDKRGGRKSSHG